MLIPSNHYNFRLQKPPRNFSQVLSLHFFRSAKHFLFALKIAIWQFTNRTKDFNVEFCHKYLNHIKISLFFHLFEIDSWFGCEDIELSKFWEKLQTSNINLHVLQFIRGTNKVSITLGTI